MYKIKFKKYFLFSIVLLIVFVTANVIYNMYLNSGNNYDFAYNYKEGISEDISNLNKILPNLTKNISFKELFSLLSENNITLNPVSEIDSLITFRTGQINFLFNRDSILQSIKIYGYDFPNYDSTTVIGSPRISYIFSRNFGIDPFIRTPQFLSTIFLFIIIIIGLYSIIYFYISRNKNINLLIISFFSFLLTICISFFTLFFYFNFSFKLTPDDVMFNNNYINPQYYYKGIVSLSIFRSFVFDISIISIFILLYVVYQIYNQIKKVEFKVKT